MEPGSRGTQAAVGRFCTTHWSVVLTAGDRHAPGNDTALSKLCQIYWEPAYAYVRRRGFPSDEAQDLTQEFFFRLVGKEILAGVSETGGRFRSFLLTALKRFLINEWKRAHAQKRGGDCQNAPLEAESEGRCPAEPLDPLSPDVLFERRWATALLDQVMGRMEAEYKQWRKAATFSELQPYLAGCNDTVPYRELGSRLGMSEGAIKVAVHRLCRRYGELLRDEISRTVGSPVEIDDEIRHLIFVLSG